MHIVWKIHVQEKRVPRSVVQGSVYTIATRNTMLAFHKIHTPPKRDYDPLCTKTDLLMFMYEHDAVEIAHLLEKTQLNIHKLERDIQMDPANRALLESSQAEEYCMETLGDSLKPIHIEPIPYSQLEQLCIFHHFDMLIAYHHRTEPKDSGGYTVHLQCYEYITEERLNRVLQEKIFRDMFYSRGDS